MPLHIWLSAAAMLAMALLGACIPSGQHSPPASPTPAVADPSPQPSPTPSATPSPSVLWVVGNPGDELPIDSVTLISVVSGIGALEGLIIEQANDPASLPAGTPAAILAMEPSTIAEMVSRFPGKPILLITSGPMDVGTHAVFNLYFPELAVERQAMLAGYSAALITKDWRVAALTAPEEGRVSESILQGAIYMCGLCRPTLPPYANYPLSFQLDPGAGPGQLEAVAAEMSLQGVETVVLSPSLVQGGIVSGLAKYSIQAIGMGSIETGPSDAWAATIQYAFESTLAEIWPSFLAGEAPLTELVPLQITDRSPQRFTDARLRLAEQVAQEITVGAISPIP